jgi:hypothetical protein
LDKIIFIEIKKKTKMIKFFIPKYKFIHKFKAEEEEEEEEEELVDPKTMFDQECEKLHCQKEVKDYMACLERTKGTDKNCSSWMFDIKSCVSHCVRFILLIY